MAPPLIALSSASTSDARAGDVADDDDGGAAGDASSAPSSSWRPSPASVESSRNGAPGSSSRPTRSRGRSWPRSRIFGAASAECRRTFSSSRRTCASRASCASRLRAKVRSRESNWLESTGTARQRSSGRDRPATLDDTRAPSPSPPSARYTGPVGARTVSWAPFGIGHVKPHHFASMARVAWENRDELPYAWRILRDGVCDGCALGTTGLADWTLDSVHLCMVRLELMRLNTMPAFDPRLLDDVSRLDGKGATALRELGRLPVPLRAPSRRPRIPRDLVGTEALGVIAAELRQRRPAARRLLPDLARHSERDVLRRAEGRSFPRLVLTSTTRRGSATPRPPWR